MLVRISVWQLERQSSLIYIAAIRSRKDVGQTRYQISLQSQLHKHGISEGPVFVADYEEGTNKAVVGVVQRHTGSLSGDLKVRRVYAADEEVV